MGKICPKCGKTMFQATAPTVTTLANPTSKYVAPSVKVMACTCGYSEPLEEKKTE